MAGLAGTGSAAWLGAMAGAEVGRGLLSGVITATAEDGEETDRVKVQSRQRLCSTRKSLSKLQRCCLQKKRSRRTEKRKRNKDVEQSGLCV